MAWKEKLVKDISIIQLKGKLMGGKETDECHEKFKDLIAQGRKKFIIDLSSVKWVNSRGLGMLMACYTSSQNAHAQFKIAGATEKTNSLLMITKLLTIFDHYDNVDQAIGSYKG